MTASPPIFAVLGTLTGVLGGIAVGFLASLWPTRRASRVEVLDALRTT